MAVQVGDEAPDFTLKDQKGEDVTLSSFRGTSNVVLVFYPFTFTGVCHGELCAIRDDHGFEPAQMPGGQIRPAALLQEVLHLRQTSTPTRFQSDHVLLADNQVVRIDSHCRIEGLAIRIRVACL